MYTEIASVWISRGIIYAAMAILEEQREKIWYRLGI